MSLEQIILIAARKLPASNLLATAAANLLSSDVFPLFLPSEHRGWTIDIPSLSHSAMRRLMMLLRFRFAPPLFGFAKTEGPK